MAKKKKRPGGGNRPQGHFCKVCGEHKANEKFSGKGHAAHICKACAALPQAERNESVAVRKIEGMAHRYLSEGEIAWLRNRLKDTRPAVRQAAAEVHRMKFPRFERNMAKKGLTAFSLELYIHDEVVDDWGDFIPVNTRLSAEDTGLLRRTDYSAPEAGREQETRIDPKEAKRFLKAVVHELDALFWDEDYSDELYEHDPWLDILPEYRPDAGDEPEDAPATEENREPVWSLRLELNNGQDKDMVFYNETPDAAMDLYWSLMDFFEPDAPDEDGEPVPPL